MFDESGVSSLWKIKRWDRILEQPPGAYCISDLQKGGFLLFIYLFIYILQ